MRIFEVYLNGRRLCTAGIDEAGVVTSCITWVTGPDPTEPEDMELRVSGLVSRTHTHVDWMHRILKENDEVRIVVCEKNKASKPKKTRSESVAIRKKRKLEYLKRLSKELGYEIKRKNEPNQAPSRTSTAIMDRAAHAAHQLQSCIQNVGQK